MFFVDSLTRLLKLPPTVGSGAGYSAVTPREDGLTTRAGRQRRGSPRGQARRHRQLSELMRRGRKNGQSDGVADCGENYTPLSRVPVWRTVTLYMSEMNTKYPPQRPV